MLIRVKQINNGELTDFVQAAASGSAFSGNLNGYLNANGYLGKNVVYASGGPQIISGDKTFDISPTVPYSGTTGTAPSRKYVDDSLNSISGALVSVNVLRGNSNDTISGYKTFTGALGVGNPVLTGDAVNLNTLLATSGAATTADLSVSGAISTRLDASGAALSIVKVTGSSVINNANLTGIAGVRVLYSGNFIFISGATGAGGAGSSTVQVTGSSAIASPNFTGVGNVTLTYDGTFIRVSGQSSVGAPNAVFQTGDQNISGFKLFTGSPWVPAPTVDSGAANLSYVTGISGALQAIISANTGIVINNTFNITGTGTVNNTLTSSGNMYNTFNDVTQNFSTQLFTGNLTNISFFFDPVPTGLNLAETFVSNDFTFSGARFSCRQSGNGPINGGILTGKLYQVDQNNTEQTLYNFTFTTGIIYSGSPLFSTLVTGNNRVGLSITNLISGIEKFTVGVFGY